jgi:hypothetical protein
MCDERTLKALKDNKQHTLDLGGNKACFISFSLNTGHFICDPGVIQLSEALLVSYRTQSL